MPKNKTINSQMMKLKRVMDFRIFNKYNRTIKKYIKAKNKIINRNKLLQI